MKQKEMTSLAAHVGVVLQLFVQRELYEPHGI